MTRTDAEGIIARILTDEIQLYQSDHARQQFRGRDFSPHDLRAIRRCHEMESAPEWSEEKQNYKVCLLGKCLEGRPTRMVLGFRADGTCVLVTIMVARNRPSKRGSN